MVDTPKENNDEEQKDAAEDNSLEKQPKRRRSRRSKPRLGKNSDNSARKNNTPSYDIYMVDTPKEGNGEDTAEDGPTKKQPKR